VDDVWERRAALADRPRAVARGSRRRGAALPAPRRRRRARPGRATEPRRAGGTGASPALAQSRKRGRRPVPAGPGRMSRITTVSLHGFGERYFEHLHPNQPVIDYMRELSGRGYKLAICTNNVREWSERWRSKLPVDEIFDVVIDSAFVGSRKPEPRIYELTLE